MLCGGLVIVGCDLFYCGDMFFGIGGVCFQQCCVSGLGFVFGGLYGFFLGCLGNGFLVVQGIGYGVIVVICVVMGCCQQYVKV